MLGAPLSFELSSSQPSRAVGEHIIQEEPYLQNYDSQQKLIMMDGGNQQDRTE